VLFRPFRTNGAWWAAPDAFVFACALVANAASFALPIANPSNLLFFADKMPTLGAWFASFGRAGRGDVRPRSATISRSGSISASTSAPPTRPPR
jgi:hypothetical protein